MPVARPPVIDMRCPRFDMTPQDPGAVAALESDGRFEGRRGSPRGGARMRLRAKASTHGETPAMIKTSVAQLLSEARARTETLRPEEAIARHGRDDVVFVDVRDAIERSQTGQIPGSVHAPRGMLEFFVDPESPMHNEVFSSGKQLIFYCASGGRSCLAAKTVQDMGLAPVSHMDGGFAAWMAAGGSIERGS